MGQRTGAARGPMAALKKQGGKTDCLRKNRQMANGHEYVAIQKLQHPITGVTVYLPEGRRCRTPKPRSNRIG